MGILGFFIELALPFLGLVFYALLNAAIASK
jgi:hypothetical protein